jgi:hypothetical protein
MITSTDAIVSPTTNSRMNRFRRLPTISRPP